MGADDLVVESEAVGEAVDQQPGVNQQHGPEDQVGQHHHRTAADREESAESPVKPQPLHRQERIAIVDQMGLDESLDPARTLPDPVPDMGVGLLVGRGIDQPGLVTALVNADAEVAILGHVEGVPAADLPQLGGAEVVAGAAERQRQVEELITGQRQVEIGRILHREQPGQQIVPGVEVVELALHTQNLFLLVAPEYDIRFLELVRLRRVLGVVDHAEFAARPAQAEIAGARLGPGRRVRNGHHFAIGRQPGPFQREAGFVVVGFEQQLHVELLLRVVETAHVADDLLGDIRLVIERQQNGVDRQLLFVERRDFRIGDDFLALPEPRQHRRAAAEKHRSRVPDHQVAGHEKDKIIPAEFQQEQKQEYDRQIIEPLAAARHLNRRSPRIALHKFPCNRVELCQIEFHMRLTYKDSV